MSILKNAQDEIEKRFEKLEVELNDLELKTLNAKYRALEARDSAARTFRQQVQELKKQASDGRRKAGSFSDDSSEAWNEFRAGMENAWKDLRSSVSRARARFEKTYKDDDGSFDASDAVCCSHTTDGNTTTTSPSMAASGQSEPEARPKVSR